jgi:hypothetical protein
MDKLKIFDRMVVVISISIVLGTAVAVGAHLLGA